MEATEWELAVTHTTHLFMWIAGLVVVAVLIGAFIWGRRVQARESRRPTPEEQPKLPPDGPVREIREYRDADEVPHDGGWLTPHELKEGYGTSSTHPSPSQDEADHRKGRNSSFGGGGLG
ncbi:hypothetical protein GCM10018785_01630 [Streptomyces longispororuber]|uniref:Secreted protein n=1 Tax=Streptomyces longispororuber TaxID=68230 RepID=A0A918Z4B6_9ACTN|nr:DUF6479 family protein [Streptomyces longispororuber]GHE35659.1 hypothetical protein GCM10018785_01630 [Streptomyces longispororuber]